MPRTRSSSRSFRPHIASSRTSEQSERDPGLITTAVSSRAGLAAAARNALDAAGMDGKSIDLIVLATATVNLWLVLRAQPRIFMSGPRTMGL